MRYYQVQDPLDGTDFVEWSGTEEETRARYAHLEDPDKAFEADRRELLFTESRGPSQCAPG